MSNVRLISLMWWPLNRVFASQTWREKLLLWKNNAQKLKIKKNTDKNYIYIVDFKILHLLVLSSKPLHLFWHHREVTQWVKAGLGLSSQVTAGPYVSISLIPWAMVPSQCSEGVLASSPTTRTPCFGSFGAWTENPPFFSPVPNRLSYHQGCVHEFFVTSEEITATLSRRPRSKSHCWKDDSSTLISVFDLNWPIANVSRVKQKLHWVFPNK